VIPFLAQLLQQAVVEAEINLAQALQALVVLVAERLETTIHNLLALLVRGTPAVLIGLPELAIFVAVVVEALVAPDFHLPTCLITVAGILVAMVAPVVLSTALIMAVAAVLVLDTVVKA